MAVEKEIPVFVFKQLVTDELNLSLVEWLVENMGCWCLDDHDIESC